MNFARTTLLTVLLSMIASSVMIGQENVDFSHEIVPLLKARCGECHTGENKKGGFSINTRLDLLEGGESGSVVELNMSDASYLVELIESDDIDVRMPPEGEALSKAEISLIRRWIDTGLNWEPGFAFKSTAYEPPLGLIATEVPNGSEERSHPIDRFIDKYLVDNNLRTPSAIDDSTFLRRSSLDLIGLLPSEESIAEFFEDPEPDRRERWIKSLLDDEVNYADHWLTFWNDLLRNDYSGTGFITGGRKQISAWLYQSLLENKPYDRMVRELIAPVDDKSRGFIDGIQWRGDVSAAQKVEIQFAQSVSQSFLGINMKCASCHDSFIDRWKLKDAYSLAAVYSAKPLELHRCDKPTGETAKAAWIFPELGTIDAGLEPAARLKQLAGLLTARENGRFSRTIVNRLWHRMMGRGLVHPVDAMQSKPWHEGLLDYLAMDFVEHNYDLKRLLVSIATSQAYQSACENSPKAIDESEYRYQGPRAKRLTAEQFIDAIWSLTNSAPKSYDAPIFRGRTADRPTAIQKVKAQWIWIDDEDRAKLKSHPNSTAAWVFRRTFKLDEKPSSAGIILTAQRSYVLFVNNRLVSKDDKLQSLEMIPIQQHLKAGANSIEILVAGSDNDRSLGYLFADITVLNSDAEPIRIGSDGEWTYAPSELAMNTRRLNKIDPKLFKPSLPLKSTAKIDKIIGDQYGVLIARCLTPDTHMVRAALVKSDSLMRALGRPNRDQIVSMRPTELTTLEAIELSNAAEVENYLRQGATSLKSKFPNDAKSLVAHLYRSALSREPTSQESSIAVETLAADPSVESIADLMWAVVMSPEFQYVR